MENLRYIFQPEEKRAAVFDGDKLIGFCTFDIKEKIWIIDHTVVEKEYSGQGIAAKLIDIIVNEARNIGVKIEPVCPYAAYRFNKVEEYKAVRA